MLLTKADSELFWMFIMFFPSIVLIFDFPETYSMKASRFFYKYITPAMKNKRQIDKRQNKNL